MSYKPLIKIFAWGMIISFLGSLPLGPLNLFTTYISVSKGVYAGFAFCLGCIVSELIFVRLALISMNWISKRQRLFKTFEWITVGIILTLAIFSFNAAIKKTGFTSAMPTNIRYPFLSGILFSALDPMKIPFWFLWSTFLISNKTLITESKYYNFYVVGIGVGSLLGFLLFIYGGNYLIRTIKTHQNIINWTIGGILLITAIIQIYRTSQKKVTDTLPSISKEDSSINFIIE